MNEPVTKIWGTTTCIFSSPHCEVHHLRIKKGGYSSIHSHVHKYNRFYVLSGKLQLLTFQKEVGFYSDMSYLHWGKPIVIDSTVPTCNIAPGTPHKFAALEDCEAIEVCWVGEIAEDIIRLTEGGLQ